MNKWALLGYVIMLVSSAIVITGFIYFPVTTIVSIVLFYWWLSGDLRKEFALSNDEWHPDGRF